MRINKIMISFLLLLSFLPFSGGEVKAAQEADFEYSESNGEVTITKYNGSAKNVNIPDKLGGNTVTSIGTYAFANNQLTSVSISDSVTSIGSYAFAYNQLTSVSIPNSVTSIESYAFANNQLTSVSIPDSVTSIGSYAFAYNQLTSVSIPNSVTSIGSYAFAYNQLTSVSIPDSVTSIGSNAFYYNQLTSVSIPKSVTDIGIFAFANNQLTSVSIPDSVKVIEHAAFSYNQLTSVSIPNSVTSIGTFAFYYNQLTSVSIPDSVTSIGTYAFANNLLTSVSIPDSVTSIGTLAFAYNQLTSVIIPKSVTNIENAAFAYNPQEFTIIGYDPSEAKRYADSTGNNFIKTNYKVIYLGNGHTSGSEPGDPKEYDYHEKLTIKSNGNIQKVGYTFTGWNSKPDGKGTDFKEGTLVQPEGDITLYAMWQLDKYLVKFETSGGTAISNEEVDLGKKITEPQAPTKSGYIFEGWYIDDAFSTKWNFTTDQVTKDTTLYAKWLYNNPGPNNPGVEPPKPEEKDPVTAPKLSEVSDKDTSISGTTEAGALVTIKADDKVIGTVIADNNGIFSIRISKQKAGTIITAFAKLEGKPSSEIEMVRVLDKTPPKLTVKQISDKSTTISGTTEANTEVRLYIKGNLKQTTTANAKGIYTFKIGKQKSGVTVTIVAIDKASNKKSQTIKVLDKTDPAKPIVNKVGTEDKKVTGKTEKNAFVYIYKGKIKISTSKANAKGRFSVKISKQKVGTKLIIYAKDKANNKSKSTSVIVKK
ncbi:leucine-rich repeat protein [Viridibacillus sp. NPDC093762]|uniref:leucine-rich repeat protein n=1 Tax=Viridibacillus sp. NPDC093762 TaxID=3390720 RepID=UPI003D054E02